MKVEDVNGLSERGPVDRHYLEDIMGNTASNEEDSGYFGSSSTAEEVAHKFGDNASEKYVIVTGTCTFPNNPPLCAYLSILYTVYIKVVMEDWV